MKKRIFSLFLALLMLLSLWMVPAHADENAEAVYTHPSTGAKTETTFTDAVELINRNYGGSVILNMVSERHLPAGRCLFIMQVSSEILPA